MLLYFRYLLIVGFCFVSFSAFPSSAKGGGKSSWQRESFRTKRGLTFKYKHRPKAQGSHFRRKPTLTGKQLKTLIETRGLEKLTPKQMRKWQHFLQMRAKTTGNFVFHRVHRAYLLDLGFQAKRPTDHWGLHLEKGTLVPLPQTMRRKMTPEGVSQAWRFCQRIGRSIRNFSLQEQGQLQIQSWTDNPTLYGGRNSVNGIVVPWMVMREGSEIPLPGETTTEKKGIVRDYSFSPTYEGGSSVKGGVLYSSRSLHTYIKVHDKKYFLYIQPEGGELMPLHYFGRYKISWETHGITVTYSKEDGTKGVEYFNLAIREDGDGNPFFFYLAVPLAEFEGTGGGKEIRLPEESQGDSSSTEDEVLEQRQEKHKRRKKKKRPCLLFQEGFGYFSSSPEKGDGEDD